MAKFKGAVLNCVVCQSEFKVPPNRALTAKTCSKGCADKIRGEGIKRQVSAICKMCNATFEIPRSHSDRRVFCSNVCREAHPDTVERKKARIGPLNPAWKGGRVLQSDGYIYALDRSHPHAGSNGYILEHRSVMEKHLLENDPSSEFLTFANDRPVLSLDYEVHHRDEDKANNEISNLECLTPAQHRQRHAQMRRDSKERIS